MLRVFSVLCILNCSSAGNSADLVVLCLSDIFLCVPVLSCDPFDGVVKGVS